MGNTHNRNCGNKTRNHLAHQNRDGQAFTSQYSFEQFVGNLSGRSLASVTSNQSVYSASRPWSRVSRRRWNDSTLNNPLQASKTAWPVANRESIFLPEFPIATQQNHRDFEIVNTIANGAFGKVYKVNKVCDGKEYALKVLSKSQVIGDSAIRQVKEEARIQTACGHHTFIAGAVERWQTAKRLYIVSEYIPGGELLALLDKFGRLPEELVKVFVAEIAIALDFLHNAGVIYRDLKPENILLDANYHIKLIDFGLSKWLSIGARTTTICGTIYYIAPEVLSHQPYGHAVDWWSLGVVACRMLTDEYPKPAVETRPDSQGSVTAGTHKPDSNNETNDNDTSQQSPACSKPPGSLPVGASDLSKAARGLLLRLLDRDPRVRMRSLRQLEQSAFYLGYNLEHVKAKRMVPLDILKKYYTEEQISSEPIIENNMFESFDQSILLN